LDQTIGMIGIGIMGSAMSANLLKDGFAVIGYDILPERVETLKQQGGVSAANCRDVAAEADVIITSLPSVAALEAAVAGENGLVSASPRGLTVIETSTLPLDAKLKARDALENAGIHLLDCPLSGTGAQAVHKDLAVLASGEPGLCKKCRPVFDGFARVNYYVGEFGMGSKMKFIANLLVTIHNVSAAEAFALGKKAGIDPEMIYKVISDGAGTSRMFEVRGPLMVTGQYDEATMKMRVFQKDIDVITDFAAGLACPTPVFSASSEIYAKALADGRDNQDTAAVCAVLEEMAGISQK